MFLDSHLMGRVYVFTRVGTRVVNRTCATMILLERDSTYSGRFQNAVVLFFIDGSKKDTSRPV